MQVVKKLGFRISRYYFSRYHGGLHQGNHLYLPLDISKSTLINFCLKAFFFLHISHFTGISFHYLATKISTACSQPELFQIKYFDIHVIFGE